MTTKALALPEFTAVLRRWFFAEDLSETEIQRLYAQWVDFAGNEARLRGQYPAFEPRNRIAFGYEWWEERQQGRRDPIWPQDPVSRLKMFLTHEGPPAGPMPSPRPYCPSMIVGRWRCIGKAAAHGGEVVELTGQREWLLGSDGTLAAVGDPAHDGMKWCAHRGTLPEDLELRIGPKSPALDVEYWGVVRHRGAEMDLSGPGTPAGFLRWGRAPGD